MKKLFVVSILGLMMVSSLGCGSYRHWFRGNRGAACSSPCGPCAGSVGGLNAPLMEAPIIETERPGPGAELK